TRDLRLRRPVWFVHEHFLHLIEEPHIAGAAVFFPQPRHYLLQQRESPTPLIHFIGGGPVAALPIDQVPLLYILERNQALSFAALQSHGMARLVGEKMFHRRKQVRTKASLFLAHGV